MLLLGDEVDSLQERLKVRPGEDFDPIPCQLLRKYLGYARKYVHPRLGTQAADELQVRYGGVAAAGSGGVAAYVLQVRYGVWLQVE